MEKTKIKIEEMSVDEFNNSFKGKYLDKEILTDEDLTEIRKQFGPHDMDTMIFPCNEFHSHNYSCVYYHNPEAGVVDRLLNEINRYKVKIEKVKKTLDN